MKYIAAASLTLSLLLCGPAIAKESTPVEGLWLTKKQDAAIKVEQCGEALCGYIAWLHTDENPYSISGKPLCKAQVLSGFHADKDHKASWSGGKVYKADDDKTYNGAFTLTDSNTVKLRVYLGIPALGKTKTFTRVSAKDYPPCTVPPLKTAQKVKNTTNH